MSMIWNGRGWSAKNIDKKPVEIQWNQQIVTADYLVVPKGSPNKDAAMKFIAYTACAANNAAAFAVHPVRPDEQELEAEPDDASTTCGHQRRRELGLLRRQVPHRQLRRRSTPPWQAWKGG